MQIQWSRYVKWAVFTAVYWLGKEKPRLFSEATGAVVTFPIASHSSALTVLTMLCLMQRAAAEDLTVNLELGTSVNYSIDLTQLFGRSDISNVVFKYPPELVQSGLKLYPRWAGTYVPGQSTQPYHLLAANRDQVEVFSRGIQLTNEATKTTFFSEGQLKWRYQTGNDVFYSPAPALRGDGTIYVGSDDGYLYALTANGSLQWRYLTGDRVHSSPALGVGGTVYVGSNDGYLYALNANGSLRWRYRTGGWVYASPALGEEDGTIYAGSNDGYLYALNANGSLQWRYLMGSCVCSAPILGENGTIYVGSADHYLYVLNVDGSLRWRYQTGSAIDSSSPALGGDGTVYVGSGDGYLYALNVDGSLRWRYLTGDRVYSSPVLGGDGTIYVGSYDHYLYALNVDGSLRWRYQTGGGIYSSPALGVGGTVYVGSFDGYFYALNANGSLRWCYQTGNLITSNPVLGGNGTIYVGSDDNYLYALSTKEFSNTSWPQFYQNNERTGRRTTETQQLFDHRYLTLEGSPNLHGTFALEVTVDTQPTHFLWININIPSVTSTGTRSLSLTPSSTAFRTNTASATVTVSISPTPSQTGTNSLTTTPATSLTPSQTNTASFTVTSAISPTPSQTNTRSFTMIPTMSSTPSRTGSRSFTMTPTASATPSRTDTHTFRILRTMSLTQSQTSTHPFTVTLSMSLTPSRAPTHSFTITPTTSPTSSHYVIAPVLFAVTSSSNSNKLFSLIFPLVGGSAALFALIFGAIKLYKYRNKKSLVVVHPEGEENQHMDSPQPRNASQTITYEMPSLLIGSNRASSSQQKPEDAALLVVSALSIIPYAKLGEKGRVLGEGGFGVVYQSTWQHVEVAVKELRIGRLSDAALVDFQEEAKRHAALRHPNIVTLFGLCIEPGHYCLVMEFMVIGSLYQVLHNLQPLPWGARLSIAKEIAIGLAYLHEQSPPMLHRDLKSLNVLLDAGMHAKLADFGLSKVKVEVAEHSTIHTGLTGTPKWMAPELLAGQRHTEFSDIYALGMVFWELASRQKPFAEMLNQFVIMEYVKSGKREKVPADTPPPFAKLISRCWAQRISDRPQSVSEVVEELGRPAGDAQSVSSVSSGYQHYSH